MVERLREIEIEAKFRSDSYCFSKPMSDSRFSTRFTNAGTNSLRCRSLSDKTHQQLLLLQAFNVTYTLPCDLYFLL